MRKSKLLNLLYLLLPGLTIVLFGCSQEWVKGKESPHPNTVSDEARLLTGIESFEIHHQAECGMGDSITHTLDSSDDRFASVRESYLSLQLKELAAKNRNLADNGQQCVTTMDCKTHKVLVVNADSTGKFPATARCVEFDPDYLEALERLFHEVEKPE